MSELAVWYNQTNGWSNIYIPLTLFSQERVINLTMKAKLSILQWLGKSIRFPPDNILFPWATVIWMLFVSTT